MAVAGDKDPKPIQVKDKVTVKAKVEAIDKSNRTITIKGPKGYSLTLLVDEAVQRFDAIKVGDTITAKYYESVVIEVRKAGEVPASASVAGTVAVASGVKPAGAGAVQETMTVTITAIDPNIPAVMVRTVDGEDLGFRVQKKHYLKNVAVGDQVVISHTTGVAVEVTGS